jgi:hypothetical protein
VEVKGGFHVRLTTTLPSVSQPSRKCGSLYISQPYRTPWPVAGIVVFFFCGNTVCNIVFLVDNSVVCPLPVNVSINFLENQNGFRGLTRKNAHPESIISLSDFNMLLFFVFGFFTYLL